MHLFTHVGDCVYCLLLKSTTLCLAVKVFCLIARQKRLCVKTKLGQTKQRREASKRGEVGWHCCLLLAVKTITVGGGLLQEVSVVSSQSQSVYACFSVVVVVGVAKDAFGNERTERRRVRRGGYEQTLLSRQKAREGERRKCVGQMANSTLRKEQEGKEAHNRTQERIESYNFTL